MVDSIMAWGLKWACGGRGECRGGEVEGEVKGTEGHSSVGGRR